MYGGQRTIHRSQFASYHGSPRPQLVRLGSKRLCRMRQLTPILSLTRVVACLNMGALGGWGEGEGRGSHRQLTSRLITEVLLSSLGIRAAQLTLLERIFSEVSRRTSEPCSNIVLSLGFFFGGGYSHSLDFSPYLSLSCWSSVLQSLVKHVYKSLQKEGTSVHENARHQDKGKTI